MGWLHAGLGRVVVLALLVLSLQLPIHWIHQLVGEREANRHAAVAEVQASAGGARMVRGPVLLVPYLESHSGFFDPTRPATTRNYAILRPETLEVSGTIAPLVRTRGIFDVLVYQASLHIDAVFARPDPVDLGLASEQIIWEEVMVGLASDDVPGSIEIDGASIELGPGAVDPYVVAIAPEGASFTVAYDVAMSGSHQLLFCPLDNVTSITLASEWPHPKFVGTHLPETRDVREDGFSATWRPARRTRPRLEAMHGRPAASEQAAFGSFGVELLQPVDAYRMTRRAMKYELLFTTLTLGVFFLVEVFSRARVHMVQYVLVGSALVLFYLLILSLSEHISFTGAYVLASLGVVGLVWGYARAVFEEGSRSAVVGAVLSGLYGFLFVLLAAQDYSLLMGSLGLFLMLASVMFFTRNVDWFALGDRESA